MKKFLLLAVAALGVLAFFNTVTPAADVKLLAKLASNTAEDDYGQLFCLEEADARSVATAFMVEQDSGAIRVGQSLLQTGRCAYVRGVGFWQDGKHGISVCTRGTTCIGVQPAHAEDRNVDKSPLEGYVVVTTGYPEGPASANEFHSIIWALQE